jgi:hypothetical protein
MLAEKLHSSYSSADPLPLAESMRLLLDQQKLAWPQLRDGYNALKAVRVREVQGDGFSSRLQFNPKRMTSTAANVDDASIRARKCFLCLENLPPEQKGILYGDQFLILCNPAPIFDEHFTVMHIRHIPQVIAPFIDVMISLARDMSPRYSVLYNGPKCGASAPDHMHFQAFPTGAVPIQSECLKPGRRNGRNGSLTMLQGLGRTAVLVEGTDSSQVKAGLLSLMESIGTMTAAEDEPMVNLICWFDGTTYRVILFPRSKHRPDAYFNEGEERVLISPASVDMSGLIITPVEKDFITVDADLIRGIFAEVSLDHEAVRQTIGAQ